MDGNLVKSCLKVSCRMPNSQSRHLELELSLLSLSVCEAKLTGKCYTRLLQQIKFKPPSKFERSPKTDISE